MLTAVGRTDDRKLLGWAKHVLQFKLLTWQSKKSFEAGQTAQLNSSRYLRGSNEAFPWGPESHFEIGLHLTSTTSRRKSCSACQGTR